MVFLNVFAAAIFPIPLLAQSELISDEDTNKPWYVTVGYVASHTSDYLGSRSSDTTFDPTIELEYNNWTLDLDGLRYRIVDDDEFVLGVGVGYDEGRSEDDFPVELEGIGDIDSDLKVSLFAEFVLFDLIGLNLSADKSFADSDSVLLSAEIGTEFPLYEEKIVGGIGIGANWANSDHMQAYYGINAQQSERTGLTQFNPRSGNEKIILMGFVDYFAGNHWIISLTGGVEYLRLEDSPVVDDDEQPFVHLSLSYTW